MMLRHEVAAELEVRGSGDGRTVYGLCCPFNQPAPIMEFGRSYEETFAPGSFAKTISSGRVVKFLALHNERTLPLGRALVLHEDTRGLYGEFRVSKTQAGDEALELIRDGALDGLSIGFEPVQPRGDHWSPRIERTEVKLREVSATPFPAYVGALIGGVRQQPDDTQITEAAHAMDLLRQGKTLSGGSLATLQKVLDHIASADEHVDAAQPILAKLMGVPNPDDPEDNPEDGDDGNNGMGADMQDDDTRSEEWALARAWDAAEMVKRVPNDAPASTLATMYAWHDPNGDPDKKSSYKFPYRNVSADGRVGEPNPDACSAGIAALNGARGGVTGMSDADRHKVYGVLASALRKMGKTPPDLRSEPVATQSLRAWLGRARLAGITNIG